MSGELSDPEQQAYESDEPTLLTARAGYFEMAKLLARHRGKVGGIQVGSPKNVLLGHPLDSAAPVFYDPFETGPLRVTNICGVPGSGKRFLAGCFPFR